MGRRGVIVGLSLIIGQVGGWQAAKAETNAVVDASGRVLPIRQAAARAGVVGRTASPCGEATALAPEAAKSLVARVAAEESFYPEFVLSVARIESRYVSTALSDKGAYGLMQLTPDTAERFDVDLCDPEGNIRGGIRFLRILHARYRNPLFILAAYNAGEDAVRKSRGVPPFPETVRFVADVVNDFYAWPGAAGATGAIAGSAKAPALLAAAEPDLIEVDAGRPEPAASAAAPTGTKRPPTAPAAPRWNDGFVMHVD